MEGILFILRLIPISLKKFEHDGRNMRKLYFQNIYVDVDGLQTVCNYKR